MMFLIRSAFWLCLAVMFIPVDDEVAQQSLVSAKAPIGAFEAVVAASATLSDVNGFCDRNPDVCAIGDRVATTFALKAKSGMRYLSEMIDRQLGTAPQGRAEGTLTPVDYEAAPDGAPRSQANAI